MYTLKFDGVTIHTSSDVGCDYWAKTIAYEEHTYVHVTNEDGEPLRVYHPLGGIKDPLRA